MPDPLSYREHTVPAPLRPYVSALWTVTSAAPLIEPAPNRVIPDGAVDIIVEPSGISRFVGAMRRPVVIPMTGQVALGGVRFHSGRAAAFLGMPLHELADRTVPAADLLGPFARTLDHRLSDTDDLPAALAMLVDALLDRVHHASAPPPAVAHALDLIDRSGGGLAVATLSREVNLSPRHFERRFREHVGLSPKMASRVVRVRRAIARLKREPRQRWSRFAFEQGYADQAHFIREFRALIGVTPARFARQGAMADSFNTGGDEPR